MKVVIDTNTVSVHVVPFAMSLLRLLKGKNVSYLYFTSGCDPCRNSGIDKAIWDISVDVSQEPMHAATLRRDADVILENNRDFDVMRDAVCAQKKVFYSSERWFKPIRIDVLDSECASGRGLAITGFIRMVFPFAIKRAFRMMKLLREGKTFIYLPCGIHAARDMARLCGLMGGDLRCIFRAPKLGFESRPGGRIWAEDGKDSLYCLHKMRMWGYFVSPSFGIKNRGIAAEKETVRVLWVGRMIGCKCLETIIRAVKGVGKIDCDLFGSGPDETRIRRLASGVENVHFHGLIPMSEVRKQMREHDVYVLSSNAFEGWGAVVSEALEEGMKVVGTYEAGASATILPESNLFHARDWRTLRRILQGKISDVEIGEWSADYASRAFVKLAEQ